MSEHRVTVLEARRCRRPTAGKSILEKLIGCRMLVPNGNCRHGSQSGGIVNQKYAFVRNNYIVSELVLSYHFGDHM
jgi:hypothetical protein